ncbi:MAG: PDZ domain-containing protein [Candidatus Magnetomorum sp.]|nr:PDZ domain-containing protein [Candidatus Magnetomorum sp.]
MNKSLIMGPVTVIICVIILAMMYEWVGNVNPNTLVGGETPELALAQFPTNTEIQPGQLVNNPSFPIGIGNGQIQLINQAQAQAPYLGVRVTEINAALATELKLPPKTGVYVSSVYPKSPAEKAGIQTGDALLKCDHKPVNQRELINRILQVKKAGDVIKILVQRNGRKKSFHVKLETAPAGLIQIAATAVATPVWMGADIQNIDAVMKMQFKLKDKKGVIISHVTPSSPASVSGLKTGDVIRRFDGTRIRDVKQLQGFILKGQPGQQVQLTVLRNDNFTTIPIVLGQKPSQPDKIPFLGPADIAIEGTWIGMDVSELSPNDVGALGLPDGTTGIVVNDVESPPALTLGFQTGDVITSINGVPTPDMKRFVTATKQQTSAVVDLIRGNKHLFMTVPPPGFTRQGTKIHTGNTNFKQVANMQPIHHRVAILSSGPQLNATVSGNMNVNPFIILVDFSSQSYAVLDQSAANALVQALKQNNVSALICGNISQATVNALKANGLIIYSGVVGTNLDAIHLYETSKLWAMN